MREMSATVRRQSRGQRPVRAVSRILQRTYSDLHQRQHDRARSELGGQDVDREAK